MKRFTLRVSKMVNDKLSKIARQEQLSKNQTIIRACEKFILNYESRKGERK